jgi:hypothetical protein
MVVTRFLRSLNLILKRDPHKFRFFYFKCAHRIPTFCYMCMNIAEKFFMRSYLCRPV